MSRPATPCPDCGRTTETVTEENYFFKLSAFQRKLLELLRASNPTSSSPRRAATRCSPSCAAACAISPSAAPASTGAFPCPAIAKHVIYVWLDALANYITALGYGSDDDPKTSDSGRQTLCAHGRRSTSSARRSSASTASTGPRS